MLETELVVFKFNTKQKTENKNKHSTQYPEILSTFKYRWAMKDDARKYEILIENYIYKTSTTDTVNIRSRSGREDIVE